MITFFFFFFVQIFSHSLFELFNLGNTDDYLNVVIKDGGISVQMKVTTGKLDMYVKPNRVRFDDYRWHKVSVRRHIKEVSFKFISIQYLFNFLFQLISLFN